MCRLKVGQCNNDPTFSCSLFGSSAKFVQGNIYDMPADLGTFDVTLVGAILLHLREPWGALRQAAQRTTDVMIVTVVLLLILVQVLQSIGDALVARAGRR